MAWLVLSALEAIFRSVRDLGFRFGRIIGWKGCTQLRKYMHRWRSMVDRSKQYNESGVEIARLRSEVCNLKAVLHDLTNKEEVAASLAAERSLNRCAPDLDVPSSCRQL